MRSKALLMLFIFLLNTVTGFSCALHMSHQEHDEATENHHEHRHHIAKLIVHQQPVINGTFVGKNDPCCQGAINNFVSLAKLLPQSGHVVLQAPFAYISSYFQFSLKPLPDVKSGQLISVDERQRPPTNDIRIAIQSFQI